MNNKSLISMVDFVIQESAELKLRRHYSKDFSRKVIAYANFLKQPLTLGMFVPVDESGNLLSDPKDSTLQSNYRIEEYNKAKEAVLFEGFSINEDSLGLYVENIYSYFVYQHSMSERTIQDLTSFKIHLTLTPTALKTIYG